MFAATFEEAKSVLSNFIPRAALHYAQERNFDKGPADRTNVSLLSSAIQRRTLSEKEVISAVLKNYSWEQSEKFVQEVLWRSYWKSWLELRPSVWRDYRNSVEKSSLRSPQRQEVLEGKTGISCFDEWRKELRETGYLHNHARMWFASIWIFTLELPWFLGAKLFQDELLDFDAASNTLSWRWVAGLHTQGKHYLARAENIHRFTQGRFNPVGQLKENAIAKPFTPTPIERKSDQKKEKAQKPEGNVGLLLHSEDLSVERTEILDWGMKRVGFFQVDRNGKTPAVVEYEKKATEDFLKRWPGQKVTLIQDLKTWVKENQLDGICLIRPWQGPLRDTLWPILEELKKQGCKVKLLEREYDGSFEGKARSGFFSFKEEIKPLLKDILANQGLEKLFYVDEQN